MALVKKLFTSAFTLWFLAVQLVWGTPSAFAQASPTSLIDVEPPLIEHEILAEVDADVRQTFVATVVDDDELDSVSLFYRFDNDPTYSSILMRRVSFSSTYIAHVPTDPNSAKNVEYYIQARDKSGNRTVRGYAFNPLVRNINVPETEPTLAAIPEPTTTTAGTAEEPKKGMSKVLYVVLGVLAVGLVAGLAGGSDSTSRPANNCVDGTCNISITLGQP